MPSLVMATESNLPRFLSDSKRMKRTIARCRDQVAVHNLPLIYGRTLARYLQPINRPPVLTITLGKRSDAHESRAYRSKGRRRPARSTATFKHCLPLFAVQAHFYPVTTRMIFDVRLMELQDP